MFVSEKRCYGKFEVTTILVDQNIDAVADVFSKMKFVAFRVEHNYMIDHFMYEGWSPLFKKVELGCVIPTYRVLLTQKSANAELEVGVEKL